MSERKSVVYNKSSMRKRVRCQPQEKAWLAEAVLLIVMLIWFLSVHEIPRKFWQHVHSAKEPVAKNAGGQASFDENGTFFGHQKRYAPTHNQPIV